MTPDAAQPFGAKGVRIQEITDGKSNTLLVVEGGEPETWTRPADVNVLLGELPRLGGLFKDGFHALFADGHVDFIRQDITADVFRLLVLRQDGTPLPEGWNDRPGGRGGRSPATMKAREPGGGFGGGPPGGPVRR
jgi:prepilin-type processing-associated H-X9-DG protein